MRLQGVTLERVVDSKAAAAAVIRQMYQLFEVPAAAASHASSDELFDYGVRYDWQEGVGVRSVSERRYFLYTPELNLLAETTSTTADRRHRAALRSMSSGVALPRLKSVSRAQMKMSRSTRRSTAR